MANYNDQAQWGEFLAEFTARNRGRRARFERFEHRSVEEEEQEARLENITVKMTGADAPQVIVTRLDDASTEPEKVLTTISRVKRLNPRYDTDNSEDGLEIEDYRQVLLILRMESRVDGVS